MITYIFKATLFSALLFAIYHFFLEKEKMPRFNRFFLLFTITLPLLIPLITVPAIPFLPKISWAVNLAGADPAGTILAERLFPDNLVTGGSTETGSSVAGSNKPGTGLQNSFVQSPLAGAAGYNLLLRFLLAGYLIVSLAFLYRFVKNIISVRSIIISNKSVPYFDGRLVLTEDDRVPHSFLKFIFVNREEYERGAVEREILDHELTHVRQKHTLDILLIELILVFAWINPVLFFCRKAIRLNHEFLADQAVMENYADLRTYQLLLVEKVSQPKSQLMSSPFNYLLTKKRIMMMSKKTSPGGAFLKQIAIMPLIVAAAIAFSAKGCTDEAEMAGNRQAFGNMSWELAGRTDASGIPFNEITGEFEGRMEDNNVSDIPIRVKIFVTNRKGGEMFTEFYESAGGSPENLHKKFNQAFNFTTQSVVDIEVTLPSGETLEMQQMVGGSHMWDFYSKPVPPPPGAPEGANYAQFRTGDLLKLILDQDDRVSITVDFRSIEEFKNKIYRFDIDPAGLKELFAGL